MLLRFRCANFRSIREEQQLSLIAAPTRSPEHQDAIVQVPDQDFAVVRSAAIYGANASGKSNVLRAIRQFKRIVSDSQRRWEPTAAIPAWDPFKLDDASQGGESSYGIDFVMDSHVYTYGFRFNHSAVVEEWLHDNTAKRKILFARKLEGQSVSVSFPSKNLGSTSEEAKLLDVIRLQTRANSLFLSAAAQSNHELLSKVFKWIVRRFHILRPKDDFMRSHTANTCATPDQKQKVTALLAAADTGILDFKIAQETAPEHVKQAVFAAIKAMEAGSSEATRSEAVPDTIFTRDEITMLHRGQDSKSYPLPFDDESSGTRAYFYMLGPILDELKRGGVILIDELESSLHPKLARLLVQMFNDPELNPKGAQLIFATHATNLLDLNLMRRDQFWITEKGRFGATELTSLIDYRPRKEQNVESAYLHGRFGGVPFLDEELLRSALISLENEPSLAVDHDESL